MVVWHRGNFAGWLIHSTVGRLPRKTNQRLGWPLSDGNMGCPHEEGQDFPHGEDCPFCPFWKGKQGSAADLF
jgi:hypothetical protein